MQRFIVTSIILQVSLPLRHPSKFDQGFRDAGSFESQVKYDHGGHHLVAVN